MRSCAFVIAAVIGWLFATSTALAVPSHPWADAFEDGSGAAVEVGDVVTVPTTVGQPANPTSDSSSSWQPRTEHVECGYGVASDVDAAASGLTPGQREVVAVVLCSSQLPTFTVIPDPAAGSPLAPVDPVVLMQVARNRLVLPEPSLNFSPEGSQLVQLASWLWVDPSQWRVAGASASAGSVTATVTAVPVRTLWDMGNGDVVVCDGPGVVYERRWAERPDMTDCKYTYRHSSAGEPGLAYQVTAAVEWSLSWSASGAPGGGDLGTVVMSTTVPIRVDEIQAVIVS